MAIHLTPTELGREAGMHRREVITKCMELGVPIFQGRIDKTLFTESLKDAQRRAGHGAARQGIAPPRTAGGCDVFLAAPRRIRSHSGFGGGAMEAVTAPASGTGSKTMADLAALAAAKHGDAPALRHKVGEEWQDVSYSRARRRRAARPAAG